MTTEGRRRNLASRVSSLAMFSRLRWIDRRPLIDTIEPYRRELFTRALDTFRPDGAPVFNLVLSGRAKKNWKSTDLVLAALYKLAIPDSAQGNDGLIVANDEGQAADDLSLAKKLIAVNADLGADVRVLDKSIRRKDGKGALQILSARDATGAHGKTALFVGFDEIHGLKNWDMLEALQPDPTRPDVLSWITSYDTLFNRPGIPLFDLKAHRAARRRPSGCWSPGTRPTGAPTRRSPTGRPRSARTQAWGRGRRAWPTSSNSAPAFRRTSFAACT